MPQHSRQKHTKAPAGSAVDSTGVNKLIQWQESPAQKNAGWLGSKALSAACVHMSQT
jgi:hypothetical protein